MFRLINFFILLGAFVTACVSAYWYMTVPQPAKMKDQVTFATDTAIFNINRFKQGGDETTGTWRDLARAGNSAAELYQAQFLFAEAKANAIAYNEALPILERLAMKGIPEGQNAYGVMLRDGLGGIEPNKIDAYKWFSLAAARGSKLAEENVLQMAHEMTAIDITEGEVRASTWMLEYLKK